jgi:hypothetical protein
MHAPKLKCPPDRQWTCQLAADWSLAVPALADRVTAPYVFRVRKADGACREWLSLAPDGEVTLRADYATDGCSLVPDFPEALPGCILHDALRQATTLDPACPWTRGEADRIFRTQLRADGFGWLLSWIYYLGVAGPTGWIYSWVKRWFFPPKDRVCGK